MLILPDKENEMIKIKLHEENCTFCGTCAKMLPDIFKMNTLDAGLIREEVEDELSEKLKNVIRGCPGDAIELTK